METGPGKYSLIQLESNHLSTEEVNEFLNEFASLAYYSLSISGAARLFLLDKLLDRRRNWVLVYWYFPKTITYAASKPQYPPVASDPK